MSSANAKRDVLVQLETPNLIPERDLGQIPVLCEWLFRPRKVLPIRAYTR